MMKESKGYWLLSSYVEGRCKAKVLSGHFESAADSIVLTSPMEDRTRSQIDEAIRCADARLGYANHILEICMSTLEMLKHLRREMDRQ